MYRCIDCGRFPFCCKIKNSQQESCEEFIVRTFGVEIKIDTSEIQEIKEEEKRKKRRERYHKRNKI